MSQQASSVPSRFDVAVSRAMVTNTAAYMPGNSPEQLEDLLRTAWFNLKCDFCLRTGRPLPTDNPAPRDAA